MPSLCHRKAKKITYIPLQRKFLIKETRQPVFLASPVYSWIHHSQWQDFKLCESSVIWTFNHQSCHRAVPNLFNLRATIIHNELAIWQPDLRRPASYLVVGRQLWTLSSQKGQQLFLHWDRCILNLDFFSICPASPSIIICGFSFATGSDQEWINGTKKSFWTVKCSRTHEKE